MRLVRWVLLVSVLVVFVLVPFLWFGRQLDNWVVDLLTFDRHRGLTALLLTSLLGADILLPIPSSLISTSAGYRSNVSRSGSFATLDMKLRIGDDGFTNQHI